MPRLVMQSLLAGLILTLAACGFQLRGAADLPASLQTMHIQGISLRSELGLELKRTLERNGVRIVESYEEGVALLTVKQNQFNRQVLSVGASGRANEYELTQELVIRVTDAEEGVRLEDERFEARRDYQYDPIQVLGREDEERLLRDDMNKQLSQAVLRRLDALD